jgi:sulfur-oxidizing protein SoxX
MRKSVTRLVSAGSLMVLAGSLSQGLIPVNAQEVGPATTEDEVIEQGRQIAFDRKTGNCLACHVIEGGTLPGNIGPPLVAMKARFPDKALLRAQIADATRRNPATMMPPFEKYGILSSEEVNKVTEFIYTL